MDRSFSDNIMTSEKLQILYKLLHLPIYSNSDWKKNQKALCLSIKWSCLIGISDWSINRLIEPKQNWLITDICFTYELTLLRQLGKYWLFHRAKSKHIFNHIILETDLWQEKITWLLLIPWIQDLKTFV